MAALALCLASPNASAEIIRVGPEESIRSISQAAKIARDGDTVLIMPGTYRGDVAAWNQKALTIRGSNPRPVLLADGKSAEGKAIWVIRNGNFRVENIEFSGARVPDANGAGIRFERGRLEVANCVFHNNQMGLLTANFEDAELVVSDSSFYGAARQGSSLTHLLYVGRIRSFQLEGSRLHQGSNGHLVKSRARRTELRYNLILDGPAGTASYEVDLPNGGDALLIGNVIGQSALTENPVLVAYGAEGSAWPESRLAMSHNTLLNPGWRPAWFVRAWPERLPAGTSVETRNNLSIGMGAFTLALGGDHAGNASLPPSTFDDATLDFTIGDDTLLRSVLAALAESLPAALTPTAEFLLPVGTSPLDGQRQWIPGAFQSGAPPMRAARLTGAGLQSPPGGNTQPQRDE